MEAHTATVLYNRRLLNVRPELPLGLTLREAHIMAAHRPLATYITFSHNFTLPDARFGGVQIKGDRLVAHVFDDNKNDPLL